MNDAPPRRFPWPRVRGVGAFALVAVVAFMLGAVVFRGSCTAGSGSTPAHSAHGVHDGGGTSDPAATIWTCAMHPQIRQPEPGKCPICGMDLVKVTGDGDDDARPDRVTLSPRAQALARLRTTTVHRMVDPTAELRLLGRIEADETRSRAVTAWIGGRIDRLHVRTTGERVRAGQTIATLYSPEVLAAHQDLIAAGRQVTRMGAATPTARTAAEAAREAARDRLRLLGVTDDRVLAMESAEQPTRQIDIRSPFAGTVIERLATEGAFVATGQPLYRVADLSTVWVQLDAYERDLSALQVGQAVSVNVTAIPEESFDGKVAFIDPTVDPMRRTARVRVEVSNKDGRLRPGMFAHAIVQGTPGVQADRPLAIPHTAALFTGRRSLVYVEVPHADRPTYEARVVRLAPRAGDVFPVVAGLAEGERVVTKGAFVLDADLQIRGGASMMAGPDDLGEGPWDQVIELPTSERQKLRPVVSAYLELQQALTRDDLPGATAAGLLLRDGTVAVNLASPQTAKDAWAKLAEALGRQAVMISQADTLEGARAPFEALSAAVEVLLRIFGDPLDRRLSIAFCPMAHGRGATWVQAGEEVENPYFGPSMLDCGELREHVAPGAYLPMPVTPRVVSPGDAHQGHKH
jgi:membrane fusion protein, copper/silver efflux system